MSGLALASRVPLLTLRFENAASGRRRRHGRDAAMSYVDAALAPQRKTGQVKIHGPAAFESMRRAGRLAAECLDMLTAEIRPGVTTDRLDRLAFDFALGHGAMPATLM